MVVGEKSKEEEGDEGGEGSSLIGDTCIYSNAFVIIMCCVLDIHHVFFFYILSPRKYNMILHDFRIRCSDLFIF